MAFLGNVFSKVQRLKGKKYVSGGAEVDILLELPVLLAEKVVLIEKLAVARTKSSRKVDMVLKSGFLLFLNNEKDKVKVRRVVSLLGTSYCKVDEKKLKVCPNNDKGSFTIKFKSEKELICWNDLLEKSSMIRPAHLHNFEKVKTLGKGHFGQVDLVTHRKNKGNLAMKRIILDENDKNKNKKSSLNERVILEKTNLLKNQYKVSILPCLLYSFKQDNMLYLITDAFLGGNLLELLQKKRSLNEESIRFIASELFKGLFAIHDVGIAHRDIKLENIVLTSDGYVKLVDFGLSKQFKKIEYSKKAKTFPSQGKCSRYSRSFSIVGTAYYQPPEMLNRFGHTLTIDFWQVGCLVYELFIGKPAFLASSYEGIKERIVSTDSIAFPNEISNMSKIAEDFIRSLLIRNPTDRLGYVQNDIKQHNFFGAIEWDHGAITKPSPLLHFLDVQGQSENETGIDKHIQERKGYGTGKNMMSLVDLACNYTNPFLVS